MPAGLIIATSSWPICWSLGRVPIRGSGCSTSTGSDGGDGFPAQRPHRAAVVLFVTGEEIIPGVVDDLPEGRGARAARVVNRGHNDRVGKQDSRRDTPAPLRRSDARDAARWSRLEGVDSAGENADQ